MTPTLDAPSTVVELPLKWRKFVASKVTQGEFEGPQEKWFNHGLKVAFMNCAKDLEDSLRLVPIHTPCGSQTPAQPTPTELAMIAAPLLAAAIVNASAQSHGIRNSLEVALALWQEARRVLQEQETTPKTHPGQAGVREGATPLPRASGLR